MTFEEVTSLFAELCRQQDLEEIVFDASESATLPVGEADMVLHIQYRREMGDIVLLAPLGEIPDAAAVYVLEMLLSANLYWKATNGATLAWNIELAQPILQFAVPSGAMTAPALAAVLADFLAAAEKWRENVAQLVANVPENPEPDDNGEEDEKADEPPPRYGDARFIEI